MKHILGGAATLALLTGTASADGISRADIPLSAMFEKGNYAQLSFSHVTPGVSGKYPAALGGGSTGNMSLNYSNVGAALKMDLTEKFSLGLFFGQPYGAQADYPAGAYTGLQANWDSNQIAAIGKYQLNNRFSVYGGLRYVESSAQIAIPDLLIRGSVQGRRDDVQAQRDGVQAQLDALTAQSNLITDGGGTPPAQVSGGIAQLQAGLGQLDAGLAQLNGALAAPAGAFNYTANGKTDGRVGYVLGAAYEIPDIALRVALTYESAITHKFDTAEANAVFGFTGSGTTEVEMPQSVRLDFQSGIAADTLLFGSIEWTEWSKWEVAPPQYEEQFGQRVTGLDNDVFKYQLGVGRKFSDTFSGFARVTYESSNGGVASRLAPTDGSIAYGLGGTWTNDNIKLTAGLEYVQVGDAEDGSGVKFEGNDAIGFGMSIGFKF